MSDIKHYSSSSEVPKFTGGRNPGLRKHHKPKKKSWYKRIGFADWFWIIFIIGAVSFVVIAKTHKPAQCDDPKIKGNISMTTGEKIYHEPGDEFYAATQIDKSQGEKMFCTAKDAEAAGWRHAKT